MCLHAMTWRYLLISIIRGGIFHPNLSVELFQICHGVKNDIGTYATFFLSEQKNIMAHSYKL